MIGTRVGHYAIQEKLGEGGRGIVYKAHDTRLLRAVAIKILPPHLIPDEKNRLRFIYEAQAASALNHPNICTIHDIGEDNGVHFIVMEFVEGQTLREILAERGALPEAEVIKIARQVCDALAAAHEKGIIHRDIKPENLMLTPAGIVKVMDFGLAKLLNSKIEGLQPKEILSEIDDTYLANLATHLRTSFSALPGTAAYMAPEQIRRQNLDGRADQFAFGVVMFELLTGVHPFRREEQLATMKAILGDEPLSPRSIRSPAHLRGVFKQSPTRGEDYEKSCEPRSATIITPAIEKIVLRCLAKNLNERYDDMTRLREALIEISNAASQREKKSFRRRATLFAAGVFVLVASVMGFLFRESLLQKEKRKIPKLNVHEISRFHGRYPPFFVGNDDKLAILGSWRKATYDTFSLWLKHPDTSEIKHLLSFSMPSTDYSFGDLSPDGRQLVVSCRAASQNGIFLVEKGQQQPRQLTDFGYWPKWSPDGRHIVFARVDWNEVGVRNAVYLYEMGNGTLRQLSPENGRFYAGPSWSPDGKWVICAGGFGSLWEIWLLAAATGEARQLSNYGGWAKWPMWSQADAAIYFLFEKNGSTNLWRAELDTRTLKLGSSLRQMTTGTPIRYPSINRIGDRLVFESTRSQERLEWMPLSEPPGVRWEKRWIASPPLPELVEFTLSPDGEQVALEQPRSGRKSIIVFSLSYSK
ncbi:MAG: protein kinase domain-containing protein [bacterium]